MKKFNIPIVIHCPLHPSEVIQRVSVDPASTKDLYCIECIFEHDVSNSSNLQSLEDFLANTYAFYAAQKEDSNGSINFEPPIKCLKILRNKEQNMANLEKHIIEEKAKIHQIFSTISKNVLRIIEEKKLNYLELLDKQLGNLQHNYTFFEDQLKKGFHVPTDNLSVLSSQELLEGSFSKVDDFSKLAHFVKRIKKDFAKHGKGINIYQAQQDKKKSYFHRLLNMLESVSSENPKFETGDIVNFTEELKKYTDERLDKLFTLKQTILSGGLSCDELESHILKPENFETIRSWIPKKYSFALQLLYRGSQHGFNPDAFHAKCDRKGATITIIECQFLGSNKKTIIGGFLDQDWHNKGSGISSEEAFLFSVDAGSKCLLSNPERAAYGGEYLPLFGEGYDLCICNDLRQSFVNPKSYMNAQSLVDPDVYRGPGHVYYFIPHNIEVYALR